MKITVFWDVGPRGSVNRYQRLKGNPVVSIFRVDDQDTGCSEMSLTIKLHGVTIQMIATLKVTSSVRTLTSTNHSPMCKYLGEELFILQPQSDRRQEIVSSILTRSIDFYTLDPLSVYRILTEVEVEFIYIYIYC
jgi:hypothetical protein